MISPAASMRMSCARTDRVTTLLFALETRGDFAEQLVLLFPCRDFVVQVVIV